jgi:uncharacterized protein involved in cysteine biosynthesis
MRSYFTKALAIVLLVALFGTPWGFYNEQLAEDARTMSQKQWLGVMDYSQSNSANSAGLYGTLIASLILFTAFVCFYEFAKLLAGMFLDRVLGPDKVGYIKSLTH